MVVTVPPVGADPKVEPDTGRVPLEDVPGPFPKPVVRIALSLIHHTFPCNSPSRSRS